MIPKVTLFEVFTIVSLLKGISGASYSQVFVQSGANVVPVEYVNYGAPAQISAAPVDSIVSVPAVVSPCVAPCVIPGPPLSAVAPISSTANAKIVSYKSPIANVPVVLANKDDTASYQYAYAVYDESTGDKKTQSEQSNGSVVQGQYSLLQPDGYRREVVYTADDLKGFNAIVRNILPESDNTKKETKGSAKETKKGDKKDLPPCKDVKSEQLKAPKTKEATKETTTTRDIENIEVLTEKPKVEAKPTPTPAKKGVAVNPNSNPVSSYNDFLACLQAKGLVQNNPLSFSPLTYILIPTLGGFSTPC